MKRPRIILADENTMMLDALKNLIEPEFEVRIERYERHF